MNNFILFFLSNLILVSCVNAGTNCNLKAIFQTPRKRNYDEFEILERSNFLIDDQGDDTQKIKLQSLPPNVVPNAKVLLRLGDYKTAIKKNNNNVNTRITLSGPSHNNYYPHPLVYPSYSEIPVQNDHQWNYAYSAPRTPQYYIFSGPNYVPRYQIIPQNVPILDQTRQNPIVFSSAIQHIPLASSRTSSSPSNGLNTMTMVPKILIDTVAKKPEILEIIETQKSENLIQPESTPVEPIEETRNKEIGEEPKSENLKSEDILAEPAESVNTENSGTSEVVEILSTPENSPQQDGNPEKPQIIQTIIEENIAPNFEETKTEVKDKNQDENQGELDEVKIEMTKLETKPVAENVEINLQTEPCEIHNVDHPRVLHPVKLSNNIEDVEIVGAGSLNLSLTNSASQKLENCSNSKDFELVNLLQKSLVPFINMKTKEEPKFLVSYPVIHGTNSMPHPTAVIVEAVNPEPSFCEECNCMNRRRPKSDIDDLNVMNGAPKFLQPSGKYQIPKLSAPADGVTSTFSGYQISSASGYYEDPTKRIVYTKPTEIVVVPPQISHSPNFVPQQYPILPPNNLVTNFDAFPPLDSSNLMNLLRYIISNSVLPRSNSINPPSPTIVRCPHCFKHHVVTGSNTVPVVQKACPYEELQPAAEKPWNPKPLPSRCPYCAKYTGELNQLG